VTSCLLLSGSRSVERHPSRDQLTSLPTSIGIAGTRLAARSQPRRPWSMLNRAKLGGCLLMPTPARNPVGSPWVIFFRSPRDCHPARVLSFPFREGDHRRKAMMSNPVAMMLHEIAQRLIQIVPSRTLRAYTTPISIMITTAMGAAKAMIFGMYSSISITC
jgi:hypothetical protein